MRGRSTIAPALFVVTAIMSTGGLGAANSLEAGAVFESFHVSRDHYRAPPAAELDDPPVRFFKGGFGARASFVLGAASSGVDLANDPIYVSFGSFAAAIGPERQVTVNGDEVELRFAARGLNHLRRFFIKQTPSGFRLRLRATRINIARPESLTLQIGDDVGQADLRTDELTQPRAFVHGVVAAGEPQAGARSAVVRMACPGGTCRRPTDEKGRFAVESDAGERALAIDGSLLGSETMTRLVRTVEVRPGTTDTGLLVLPSVNDDTAVWISSGTQDSATSVSFPGTGATQAVITIAAGAVVGLPAGASGTRRLAISRIAPDSLPLAPPASIAAAAAYAVEPAGTIVSPCAGLLIRNPRPELPDGSRVDIYTLADDGAWRPSALGTVSNGGSLIRAEGALCELTSFLVACAAEPTSVSASVTFRGTKIARVPLFVHGVSAFTTPADGDEPNALIDEVVAGCIGKANSVRAYAALPLDVGYLSGASAAVPSVAGGVTDLGEIALSMCGDGIVEGVEECDGANVGARTCHGLGFEEGTLGCTPTCVLDVSLCRTCGDGIADYGEECDAPDDSLCPGACRTSCTCPPVCGDGVRNQASERCDGADDELCPVQCLDNCECAHPATTTTTLPPQECPQRFEIIPAARAPSLTGASGMEIGFSGLGHDRDVAGGHPISVDVTCQGDSPPCGLCTFGGLAKIDARCRHNTAVTCDTIDGPDQQCGGERCDAYLLPPLHNVWGGGPSCFVERLTSDVSGSVDNETGAVSLSATLAADLYFGVANTQPCPVCRGDDLANDGVEDGTCAGGANDGRECDANGEDPTFGDTSFDCLPGGGMLGSVSPITRRIELSSDGESLAFSTPCDFPVTARACACAMCAGNPSVVCASDTDCIAAGTTGPCNSPGGGVPRKPNTCDDYRCVDSGDGVHGVCEIGPEETYCDGMLFAHGTPFLSCLSNADCRAVDDSCAGDCGECTIRKRRSCFLDPIETPGFATPNRAILSDVLCIAPGASPGLDVVGGLAGPERIMLDVGLRRVFADEIAKEGARKRRK